VGDDDVGAGGGHRPRFIVVRGVRSGQQVELAGEADHLDFEVVAHSGLFEIGPELPVVKADRREVLDTGETDLFNLAQEVRHLAERVGAADTCQHRRLLDDRQDLGGHLDHDRVRIAVRHETGQRTAARHPEPSRVVDDDQIASTGFDALGGQSGSSAGADYRLACGDLCAKSFNNLNARLLRQPRPLRSPSVAPLA
jgi:hypothetical protein